MLKESIITWNSKNYHILKHLDWIPNSFINEYAWPASVVQLIFGVKCHIPKLQYDITGDNSDPKF